MKKTQSNRWAWLRVSGLTLLSRLLGFVRDVLMAMKVGAGPWLDNYLVAFQIPNFFRRLFAEGALTQAVVPVLSQVSCDRPGEEEAFVQGLMGWLLQVIGVLTVCVMWLAPWCVLLYAPGFYHRPDQWHMATQLLRWTFPYLLCMAMVSLGSAALNWQGRFALPAAAPMLLNLTLIAALLGWGGMPERAVWAMAMAIPVAGVLQVIWVGMGVRALGWRLWPTWCQWGSAYRRVAKLMLQALYGVSVGQISLVLDTFLASFLVMGSVSWLYFANRMLQLPLALIGISLATVSLPEWSRLVNQKDAKAFAQRMDWALWVGLGLAIPAAVGLGVLAHPIMTVCLQAGYFNAHAVSMTAMAIQAFAWGLPAMVVQKLLASACYAQQDIRRPVRIATWALLINMVFSVLLMQVWGHVALAMAQSVSAWFQAWALLRVLRHAAFRTPWVWPWRAVLGAGLMGGVLMLLRGLMPHHGASVLELIEAIGVGVVVYGVSLVGLRDRRFCEMVGWG